MVDALGLRLCIVLHPENIVLNQDFRKISKIGKIEKILIILSIL